MTEDNNNKRFISWFWRILFYILSLLLLALGIILNTKAGLGVSPIVSVAYSTSNIMEWDFANTTLGLYIIFVIIEFILRGRKSKWYDILQIPLSMVFTRFIHLFDKYINFEFAAMWQRITVLIIAIILTGIGAAGSVNVKLVPNPGDGIVAAIAEKIHKSMGFTKNIFDLLCISTSFIIGLVTDHFLIGIGIGTILAVIGVGRVVALFNYFFRWFCEVHNA